MEEDWPWKKTGLGGRDVRSEPGKAVAAIGGAFVRIGKLGHVVLNVRDVERSARFYTEVLGFEISDVYPEEMVPGGMVFLRCNPDHHGIALVGSLTERRRCRPQSHCLRGCHARRSGAGVRPSAPQWGRNRLRRASPSRLPDRRRISRSRQSPGSDLLGNRSDQQRPPCAAAERMEGRPQSRGCRCRSGAGPGYDIVRRLAARRSALMADISSETIPPQPVRLADYRPPAFLIDDVDLVFDLRDDDTRVQSRLRIHRNPDNADPNSSLAQMARNSLSSRSR